MASRSTTQDMQAEEGRPGYGGYSGGSMRRERGIFISTEARPGFITTEFWLTLLGFAAFAILAYASDALGVRYGLGFAAAVLVAYVVSRGLAKAGSGELLGGSSRDGDQRDR